MNDKPTYVIVGANLTGGTAAETLRSEGFDGRIVLVGAEPDPPYERPPLSKDYLRRESPREHVFLQGAQYYREHEIDLRLGERAVSLDPGERRVELESGELVRYDRLLIATGADLRRLYVPGIGLEGVRYLRTLRDADALGDELQKRPRVLVVGAGFIGSEVAASARVLGCEVTMIEIAPVPLVRALGEEMGSIYAAIHRDHGVDVRTGMGVAEFRGARRLEAAVTTTGDVISCDIAVIGVGVASAVGWLEDSGVALENGVLTDELGRTNLPDVYAAGDVANWWHPVWRERLRLEHYDNALNQGAAVARNMLGAAEAYAPVPYFWSDQYELSLQYVGFASRWDSVVFRGDPATRSFSAFYVVNGRLRAALSVNRITDQAPAERLIRAGVPIDEQRLSDEGIELEQAAA
ncbi:MAG: FAD-dependent oxidoreductase [Dehalococcoidia bacterium]|nr:FAD-dependent oxidoreductase [Dehalococcoidia bacterium]